MEIDDSFFMDLALKEAWRYQFLTYPNPIVGAVVVKDGSILAIESHKKAGAAHAEVEAIKKAYIKLSNNTQISNITDPIELYNFLMNYHNNLFKGAKIYVTLEPCNHYGKTPPCSLLIVELGFGEVIIGALEQNKKAKGAIELFKEHNITVKRALQKECEIAIEPFNLWQKNQFVLFKHAQRLNGTVDGGYISNKASLEYLHSIRQNIDLLVIGGNTVRVDRPMLDSRFVKGKPPDVFIYSLSKDFDKDIPLFGVKNRKVFISNNKELIKKYPFVMIEGVGTMFENFKELINWHLLFLDTSFEGGVKRFEAKLKEKILYHFNLGDNLVVFLKI